MSKNLTIISGVAIPPDGYILSQEYKGGEQIDGWTVPYPLRESTFNLFKIFGLWVSSNGLCLNGKTHAPFRFYKNVFENKEPILVGDFINNMQVIYTENVFKPRLNRWEGLCIFGTPSNPKSINQEKSYFLSELLSTQKNMNEDFLKLIDDFFSQVLPLCLTPMNGTLQTGPAVAPFTALKESLSAKLEQYSADLEKKLF